MITQQESYERMKSLCAHRPEPNLKPSQGKQRLRIECCLEGASLGIHLYDFGRILMHAWGTTMTEREVSLSDPTQQTPPPALRSPHLEIPRHAMSSSATPATPDFSSPPLKRSKIVLLGDQSVGKTSLITRSVPTPRL